MSKEWTAFLIKLAIMAAQEFLSSLTKSSAANPTESGLAIAAVEFTKSAEALLARLQ